METAGAASAAAAALAGKLASFVAAQGLPGAAAGVVHGDDLVWTGEAGFADAGTRALTQPGTLYHVASITKTITGTAVLQLRDAGLLDLDQPAVAWLPELSGARSPFGPIEAVTIGRMLSHESGLATDPPGTDWAVPAYQGDPRRTLARPAEIAVRVRPGSQHKYSDLAYQLLGEIVTRVSGIPYPEYVRAQILAPLGMQATSFQPLPAGLAARRATGYHERSLPGELLPAPAMPPIWAEGGLWSCVRDLATWLSCQLRAHRGGPGPPVLAAASLREMHRPRYLAGDDWAEAWGISWCARRLDSGTWITHAGGVPGFTTAVCFDPQAQVGAVLLVNGTCFTGLTAAGLAAIARDLAAAAPPVIEPPDPVPDEYRPLLGIYAKAELNWVIQLEWRAGQLAFTSPGGNGWRLPLTPAGPPGTFTVPPGSAQSGEPVIFHRRAGGQVTSVLLAETTLVRLDPPGPAADR